ncbi:MAG: hypothetical protein M1830_002970 [Pleopsidium flavum]|nr:MAG: hypothetical protein M1830_002970 [Pleopsidium flavum]
MPCTLPTPEAFPSNLTLTITPPPASHPATNILILLHGLGDTNIPFTNLARQLSLLETACLSLQAPSPLPFDLGGFHWGDDIIFDQASGSMDFDTGFNKTIRIIKEDVIQKGLIEKCGYKAREILLFGFGQGGMAGLAVASSLPPEELGGVVSIGGPLPSSVSTIVPNKIKTPILLLGGSSKSLLTPSAVTRLRTVFETVDYSKWKKTGDGMPTNREEMLPIMQFFARRLRSRRGVPTGSVEIT